MPYMTMHRAAAVLDISAEAVRLRVLRGVMQANRHNPRRWLIPTTEVERWRVLGKQRSGRRPGRQSHPRPPKPPPWPAHYVTVGEAAARLALHPDTVRKRIQRGHMQAHRTTGQRWIVPIAEVERWASQGTIKRGPQPGRARRAAC